MKTVFYKKEGRKYIPVSEYDDEVLDSLPYGDHLISVYPSGMSRKRVEPNFAAMVAAGRYAEDSIAKKVQEASDLRPKTTPLTQEQRDAWTALSKAFGEEIHTLSWPSSWDAARAGVEAMQEEADKLMSNTAVRRAYDQFMFLAKLTMEEEKNDTTV